MWWWSIKPQSTYRGDTRTPVAIYRGAETKRPPGITPASRQNKISTCFEFYIIVNLFTQQHNATNILQKRISLYDCIEYNLLMYFIIKFSSGTSIKFSFQQLLKHRQQAESMMDLLTPPAAGLHTPGTESGQICAV